MSLAIVTGASGGIGAATAVALAEAGLEVLAIGRRRDALEQLAARHPSIRPLMADVTERLGQDAIATAAAGRSVRVLVHGAGVFPRGRIANLSRDDWRSAMATNLHARLELVLALRQPLRGGRVLFIGSDAATTPRAGGAAYSVSKAASAMLWRCLALELGDEIAFAMAKPGLVETEMMERSLLAPPDEFPATEVYRAMRQRGETIAATTVATFFRFLLLDTEPVEYARDTWDIRDRIHHPRWLSGPLFAQRTPDA